MSKFFAIALAAVLAVGATANIVVAADQARDRLCDPNPIQQRLQDGSCQTACDCICPNPDCPDYQYQTGEAYQWSGPEDEWGQFMWQYFGW